MSGDFDIAGLFTCVVLPVLGAVLYFVPLFIGAVRHHHNLGTIFVVNLLLGWTFIGWVVALAMACSAIRTGPPSGGWQG